MYAWYFSGTAERAAMLAQVPSIHDVMATQVQSFDAP